MRMNILSKIIVLVMVLSLIPLVVLSIVSLKYLESMEKTAVDNVDYMQEIAKEDSLGSLGALGEIIIKNQAMSAKELVELYIKTHPDKTPEELISDPEFQKIGIRPVGEKGYTTVILTKTQTLIAHPNKDMMGKELLEPLQNNEKMQDWWRVVETTWRDNVDSSGYYNWPEPDGSYSNKYMYLAVIETPLQGKELSIAATTYIDEFNAPAEVMDEKLSASKGTIVLDIQTAKENIRKTTTVTVLIMIVAVVLLSVIFSNRLTKPINDLTEAGKKIADGDLKTKLPQVKTNDEIQDLSATMEMLVSSVRQSKEKKK